MQDWWIILVVYLLGVNVWGIALVIADKKRAQQNRWRIRERTLFLAAALGGCPGVYLCMKKIRHKTQHKRFMIGLPAIFILQLIIAGVICYFYFF